MIKDCVGCGQPFDALRPNKKRCRKGCGRTSDQSHRSRPARQARARDLHEIEFVGVDGEGVNTWSWREEYDDDTGEMVLKRVRDHHYILLSVGDKSLHNNGEPLSWRDIFAFLWDCYQENPNATYVGFYLGYDFTCWLKTVRANRAYMLLTKEGIAKRTPPDRPTPIPYPVRVGDWEIDLLGNKRFKLRPYDRNPPTKIVNHKDGTASEQRLPRPWMYICDTGAYFQSSFLSAINPKEWTTPVVSQEEYDIIEYGKLHRPEAGFDEDMIRYNVLENDVLRRLMERVNEGFVADGIRLKKTQWFGPGQAAQEWLKLVEAPPGDLIREIVPQEAREAARQAYYGGWFEIFAHGPVPGKSYGYDINSAYPHIIRQLPCLLHGQWTHGTGRMRALKPGTLRLVNATVHGHDRWVGAMPHRNPNGSIIRPYHTAGWYWWHEVAAAKRAGLVTRTEVTEWWEYTPCPCEPPLRQIEQMYLGRLAVNKKSPHGRGKKLVYNSAYGKLAQSVGHPKFTNPIYASLITAGCRTMILDAIATHPTRTAELLMVATDSVVFRSPHPGLHLHETELGAWDETIHENLSLLMPGMYWDDDTRARIRNGQGIKLKSRGMPATDLATAIDQIDAIWRAERVPRVSIPIKFGMVSAKQAIVWNRWDRAGEVMEGELRYLDADPKPKRAAKVSPVDRMPISGFFPWKAAPRGSEDRMPMRTTPYDEGVELRSTPYDKALGEVFEDDHDLMELQTPDGTVEQLQAWALRR